jgi:hypothetical protein
MQRTRFAIAVGAALLLTAPSAQAQLRRDNTVLTSSRLPAGMCQLLIPGRSAHRQPAPTDCRTARAYAPRGSRLIHGNGQARALHGVNDPRTGDQRDDEGRWDRERDREQQQWERERARRAHEWERSRGRHGDDDEDDNDDDGDNDDNDDGDNDHGNHGQRDGRYDRRGDRCTDLNGDGICDYQQIPVLSRGALRFP